jgi:hypothetical protein
MNRYNVVNAFAAFNALHPDKLGHAVPKGLAKRLAKPELRDICDVRTPFHFHGHYPDRGDVLDNLESEALAGYFELVCRYLGKEAAETAIDEWRRINSVDGVEIVVVSSDDDPTRVDFHIQDPLAHEWAERHGSLDGGTWESCDGPEFVYDSTYWHPKLFEELQAEGFDFDFSQYSEPDEHDLEVSEHAGNCDECEYDWHKADEHLKEGLDETAVRKLKLKRAG